MKKYLLLLAVCLVVTGCSLNSNKEAVETKEEVSPSSEADFKVDPKEEEIETVEQIPGLNDISVDVMNVENEVKVEPVEVTIKTLQREYKDSNGVVVSYVRIDYPVILDESNSEGIVKINEFFKETAEALYEENNTYAIDNVESVTQDLEEQSTVQYFYSEYDVTFEVKYNANGILSILQKFSEKYTGKEEINSYATGYVFDINTGERFTIDKVLAGTNQEIANVVGQAFLDSDKIEERVKTYYKEEILANTQYVEFYLDTENINFFYNPNMVVPYAEGTLVASLPLNTNNLLKIKLGEE